MIRLIYSNRTEELLRELAARVRAEQTGGRAFVPARIVVPNAAIDGYVRLGIARERGIAANLDTLQLTRFAAAVATPEGARIADAQALEAMSLAILLDDVRLQAPELAPVRAYLHAAGDGTDTVDVRRVQFAARLGRLFEEYTYSRASLLAEWAHGLALDARHAETEGWQRSFWLAMFGQEGLARTRTPRLLPLHEAVRGLKPREGSAPPATVHVFGFAHVARTFHELFERLSRAGDVVLYALSPCEGFWEDVDDGDPEPLHLWGRAGREHVRALNAAAGFDHEDRFVDPLEGPSPRAATLLHSLQSDLLHRVAAREGAGVRSPPAAADGSIAVLEHASLRREAEAVASEIWRLVREDDSLQLDEVAVLVPPGDAAAYTTHLQAAFREAHSLPVQLVGMPGQRPNRIVEAIELLLALPVGRFTRPELLRLLTHPAVSACIDGVDSARWVSWCDALGIVHGADHADHAGTYIEDDVLNWDQGLCRLALGAFMAGDASGVSAPVLLAQGAYVPHEVAGTELHDAAAFGLLARSLLADARFARDATMTLPEWADWLTVAVETYVTAPEEADADVLARCVRMLRGLGALDVGDARVGYRVIHELARARLTSAAPARAGEGVVVSTLASLRPLPFRVVFACGMGEGRFPSPEGEDPLDLRWARRQAGDLTARERDRYGFLEMLIGTRDRLYLSYVSRDALTGEALEPSSLVQELLHAIEGGYVDDLSALRCRHALRRWDPSYFPELFDARRTRLGTTALPEARAEARTLALRRSWEQHSRRLGPPDTPRGHAGAPPGSHEASRIEPHVVRALAEQDPAWRALADHLRLEPLPDRPSAHGAEGRIRVPIHHLVKFLEFPLQGWARFRLGLDEIEDEDVLSRESEPFETVLRDETLILREVLLTAAAAHSGSIEAAYAAAVRDRALRGTGPSGVFAAGERHDHLRALLAWRRELERVGVPPASLEVHRFGPAGEHARATRVHDSVVFDLDVVDAGGVQRLIRAEIAGRTLPVGVGPTSATLFKRTKADRKEWSVADRGRSMLRAFVDHAVFAASGVDAGRVRTALVVVATPEEPLRERWVLNALTRDEATAWLRGVVRELLSGPHAYFLPCEAVLVDRLGASRGDILATLERARDRLREDDDSLQLRSAYGPVPRPYEYPAPDAASARAMIERRFGLMPSGPSKERP